MFVVALFCVCERVLSWCCLWLVVGFCIACLGWVGGFFLLGLLDSVVLRVDCCDVGLLAIRLNWQFGCLLVGLGLVGLAVGLGGDWF